MVAGAVVGLMTPRAWLRLSLFALMAACGTLLILGAVMLNPWLVLAGFLCWLGSLLVAYRLDRGKK